MEPAQKRIISLQLAAVVAVLTAVVRLIQYLIVGRLPSLALVDIPIAGTVTFLVAVRMFDPRTWSYDDDISPLQSALYTFYVTWIAYGAFFGLGFAVPFGLSMGMVYGFLASLVLVAIFGSVITIIRRLQDGP